jgi:SPP1 family phage portal protein
MDKRTLYGREVIYTDFEEINSENVLQVLERAMTIHTRNRADIQYLYDYYKGKQPIIDRTKEFRQEICNRIVENRANEIVSFKVGYLMGEPVQYVSRASDDNNSTEAINLLNDFVFAEDKAAKDKELADWFTICGTSFRMILPDPKGEEDESPFEIYTLDPRNAFVVYYSGLGNKPMMGVKYVTREDGSVIFSIYTDKYYFEVLQPGTLNQTNYSPKSIAKEEGHIFGDIPIIEYPANSARLGAFEIVLPLLDALNNVSSNRLDGIEQFIQSLLILKGVDIESDEYKALKENGGLKVPPEGDAYYLTQELNQTQTQTLVDYMYQTILVICGMPNRNGGSSTSDTGSAVIMRDGWSDAEARAKDTELMFKMSEKKFLRLAIRIANTLRDMDLKLSSIEIRFTRRNYENIQAKAQVLTTLLANDKIHPRLAFEHCGLFVDPDLAYTQSKEYADERKEEAQKELEMFAQTQTQQSKENAEEDDEHNAPTSEGEEE